MEGFNSSDIDSGSDSIILSSSSVRGNKNSERNVLLDRGWMKGGSDIDTLGGRALYLDPAFQQQRRAR